MGRGGGGAAHEGRSRPASLDAAELAEDNFRLPQQRMSLLLAGLCEGAFDLSRCCGTDARARLTEKFPTGALAVIDFPVDDWRKLHPRSGRLDRLVVPRTLEATTD